MTNKHLSVESLYLYPDHVFSYDNWSHEIKIKLAIYDTFSCKILIGYHLHRFNE